MESSCTNPRSTACPPNVPNAMKVVAVPNVSAGPSPTVTMLPHATVSGSAALTLWYFAPVQSVGLEEHRLTGRHEVGVRWRLYDRFGGR